LLHTSSNHSARPIGERPCTGGAPESAVPPGHVSRVSAARARACGLVGASIFRNQRCTWNRSINWKSDVSSTKTSSRRHTALPRSAAPHGGRVAARWSLATGSGSVDSRATRRDWCSSVTSGITTRSVNDRGVANRSMESRALASSRRTRVRSSRTVRPRRSTPGAAAGLDPSSSGTSGNDERMWRLSRTEGRRWHPTPWTRSDANARHTAAVHRWLWARYSCQPEDRPVGPSPGVQVTHTGEETHRGCVRLEANLLPQL
jgi:hypothetical protein